MGRMGSFAMMEVVAKLVRLCVVVEYVVDGITLSFVPVLIFFHLNSCTRSNSAVVNTVSSSCKHPPCHKSGPLSDRDNELLSGPDLWSDLSGFVRIDFIPLGLLAEY